MLIATDVFPPHCGGAGWSAYYLARALRARGHAVAVVRPRFDSTPGRMRVLRGEYDGLPLIELLVPRSANPLWQLIVRHWRAPRALACLVQAEARRSAAEVIHAQHRLTVPAAVVAAGRLRAAGRRIAVVATIRDYWPLCYYSTMQVPHRARGTAETDTPPLDVPVRDSSTRALLFALWRAQGPAATLRRLPLIPVWQLVTRRRRAALRAADATIAVSRFVGTRLLHAQAVDRERLYVIPNLVDLPRVDELLAERAPYAALDLAPGRPFLLFAGKLEPSKGAGLLPGILREAGVGGGIPLVLAGSGPLRPWLEAQAWRHKLDLRFADWLENADVLRLMKRATVVLFPSGWDEPLSRVLLEACAVGATVLALASGGTGDIIEDGRNGRLVQDGAAFAAALQDLLAHPLTRAGLAVGARETAGRQFAAGVVAAQVEEVYRSVACT